MALEVVGSIPISHPKLGPVWPVGLAPAGFGASARSGRGAEAAGCAPGSAGPMPAATGRGRGGTGPAGAKTPGSGAAQGGATVLAIPAVALVAAILLRSFGPRVAGRGRCGRRWPTTGSPRLLGDPWSGPAPLPGRKPVCGAAAAGPPPSPGEGLGRSHAPRRRRQCADAPGRRRRPRCALAVAAPHIDAGDALDRKRLLRSAAHAGLAVLSPGGEWLGRARGPKQGTRASRSGLRGWTGVFPPTAPGRGALRRAAPGLVAGLAPRSRARRRPLGPLPAGPVLAPSDATRGPGAPQPTGGMRPWRHGRTSC